MTHGPGSQFVVWFFTRFLVIVGWSRLEQAGGSESVLFSQVSVKERYFKSVEQETCLSRHQDQTILIKKDPKYALNLVDVTAYMEYNDALSCKAVVFY